MKIGTCDRLDTPAAATTALRSLSMYSALYIRWINGYWSQVHTVLHIFGKKTGIYGLEFRYTLPFIFLFNKLTDTGRKYLPRFIF